LKRLEDEAHQTPPERRASVFIETREIHAVDQHVPRGWQIQSRQ
jgi:hypothetical protein